MFAQHFAPSSSSKANEKKKTRKLLTIFMYFLFYKNLQPFISLEKTNQP